MCSTASVSEQSRTRPFSHGDYEEHKGRYDKVRALSKELDLPIACMLDTKGPEIRLGEFKNGVEKLTTGQKFTLTSRSVEGTNEICSVTYKELPHDVKPFSISWRRMPGLSVDGPIVQTILVLRIKLILRFTFLPIHIL